MLTDLRFALRQLRKHRGLTAVAVLTLAVGIGATTAIFSLVHAVLIDTLPYPEADRLVGVFELSSRGGRNSVSGGAFRDWAEHSASFSELAVSEPVELNLTGSGPPRRISGMKVSANYLRALGVAPAAGRDFLPGDDRPGGQNRTVLLTHGFWQSHFEGAEDLEGRGLTLDGIPYAVVGVLPPGALMESDALFLVPTVIGGDPEEWHRSGHWRSVVGRLAPGTTVEAAQSELRAVKERLNELYPHFKQDWSVAVLPLRQVWSGDVRPTLFLLTVTVLLVLLIACANVSSLLLARGMERTREMAIRGALGARPWRLARQLWVESLVLAGAGCGLGLLLASHGVDFLAGVSMGRIPHDFDPRLDARVLAFSTLLAGGCGLLFGILPALRAARESHGEGLKEASRTTTAGPTRSRTALVVAELALTLVLLVVAGLFLRSFVALLQVDPGFEPRGTLAFDLSFPETDYPTAEDRMAFLQRAREVVAGLPGVERVASASALPLSNRGRTERIRREGAEETEALVASTTFVSGPYFETMGIATVRGRSLGEADQVAATREAGGRTMVVDTSVKRELFGGEDAVGERVAFLGETWEIVGLVEPVRHFVLDRDPLPGVYLPQAHAPDFASVVVRSELAPAALAGTLREAMSELDAHLPLANVRTLEESVDRSLAARRTTLLLLQVFAGIAVALACVGIYGVMAFSVGRRTRELSIRAALGARRSQIARLVLGAGLRLWTLGMLVGLPLALGSVGLLESRLFGVQARDPVVFGAVVLLLAALAGASIYLPARRAAAVEPSEALRAD